LTLSNATRATALAAKHCLPASYLYRQFVTNGGLISYGPDIADLFLRAGGYVQSFVDSKSRGPHLENLNNGPSHWAHSVPRCSLPPLPPRPSTTIGSAEVSNVDQVGLVCNEFMDAAGGSEDALCVRYYYDPSYFPGRGYNYYAGPGYYDRGYVGLSFTIRGW
jgi:hypothetical protein